jgi:hypothetical protein
MSKFSKFSMSTFLGFNSSGFSTRALFSLLRRTRVTYYFFVLLARPCYVLLFCATGTAPGGPPLGHLATWGATPGPPGTWGPPLGHPAPGGHPWATRHLGATPGPPGTWGPQKRGRQIASPYYGPYQPLLTGPAGKAGHSFAVCNPQGAIGAFVQGQPALCPFKAGCRVC